MIVKLYFWGCKLEKFQNLMNFGHKFQRAENFENLEKTVIFTQIRLSQNYCRITGKTFG